MMPILLKVIIVCIHGDTKCKPVHFYQMMIVNTVL